MTAVLVVLVLTNLVTLALLLIRRRKPDSPAGLDAETFTAPRPAGLTGKTRRIISVEILNPMELVNNRGRVAGLAGSLAPGLARRVVYDQALKTLRRQLENKQVLADVRLHTLRPAPRVAEAPAVPLTTVINVDPIVETVRPVTAENPDGSEWVESVDIIDLTSEVSDERPS